MRSKQWYFNLSKPGNKWTVKVSFADQPAGKYSVDLIDITGKLIQSKEVISIAACMLKK
jgi:hypothetical protein